MNASAADLELVLVHPSTAPRLRVTTSPVELGRETLALEVPDCGTLSRRHAQIERSRRGLWARDLASKNGTWVNGHRVQEALLRSGDLLRLGGLLFLASPPERACPPLPDGVVGESDAMRAVFHRVRQISALGSPVLVAGETGTGKDVIARLLHEWSGRAGRFVPANCAGVRDEVAQAEIFGHVRGAFTGADRDRIGLARAAEGGTLFLDEIGDAGQGLQAGLLRLLQDGEVRPLGADRPVPCNARFVFATHRDLEVRIREGTFREDLYGRISRWFVGVPPLRERRADVLPLARAHAARLARRPVRLSVLLSEALVLHPWPMNVRELESVAERLVVTQGDHDELQFEPTSFRPAAVAAPAAVVEEAAEAAAWARRPSHALLVERLAAHGGRVSRLAKELGIARATAYRWLSEGNKRPRGVDG